MPFQRDHFTGALPSWLTGVTAAGGTVTLDNAESELVMSVGASASDAAFCYYNVPLSLTGDTIIRFSCRSTGTRLPSWFLRSSASTPTPDTATNINATTVLRGGHGTYSAKFGYGVSHWDTSSVRTEWDPVGNVWGTPPLGYSGMTLGDYTEVTIQIDGALGRFRCFVAGAYDSTNAVYTVSQGYKNWIFTDWKTFTASQSLGGNPLYFVFGFPYISGAATSGDMRVEWMSVATDAPANRSRFTVNHAKSGGGYSIGTGYQVGGDKRGIILNRGTWFDVTGTTTEASTVQHRDQIQLTDNSYVMYYRGAGTTPQTLGGIHAATFTDYEGTINRSYGLVVNVTSFPANSVVSTLFSFIDMLDPNPNRRYKLIVGVNDTVNGLLYDYLAFSANPLGPFTVESSPLIPLGANGTYDDVSANGTVPFFTNNQWEFWYGSRDTVGQAYASEISRAYGNNITAGGLTKDNAINPVVAKSRGPRQTLTAALNGRTVTVADTTGYAPDMLVLIKNQNTTQSDWVISRIRKVLSATQLELYHGLMGLTTTAKIFSYEAGGVSLHHVNQRSDGTWEFYTSVFGICGPDTPTHAAFHESTVLLTSATLTGPKTTQWLDSPLVNHFGVSPGLDSIENPAFATGQQGFISGKSNKKVYLFLRRR